MSDKGISDTEYNRLGYAKYKVSREFVNEAHSRTTAPDGKVYRGEAGRQLLRRKLEIQRYFERNKQK